MKTGKTIAFAFMLVLFVQQSLLSGADVSAQKNKPLSLQTLLDRIENRYISKGFSAVFFQESSLKAMELTDTAFGKIYFQHPGKMRWEYEKPDRQIIISDNETLWVYRPDDDQVMIGRPPSFFGNGKGAGFLSDMKTIRKNFDIFLLEGNKDRSYHLSLTPYKKTPEISTITLTVSKKTYDITRIVTYNAYGDTTVIELEDIKVESNMDDSLFTFVIPEGVDVIRLDE